MLAGKTLLILGAGASYEIDFPLGSRLVSLIRETLDPLTTPNRQLGPLQRKIVPSLTAPYVAPNNGTRLTNSELCTYAAFISQGLLGCDSIDGFVETHSHDQKLAQVAKHVIAAIMLDREEQNSIRPMHDRDHIFSSEDTVAASWYLKLWRMLQSGRSKADVENLFDQLSCINFNYDRSFEYFLSRMIARTYGLPVEQGEALVGEMEVIHPYGSLGSIDRKAPNFRAFGSGFNETQVVECAARIKTFSEGLSDTEFMSSMERLIVGSDHIVFLGFGFHAQNMRLLRSNSAARSRRQCVYATAKGISDPGIAVIADHLSKMFSYQTGYSGDLPSTVTLEPKTCLELLEEYQHDLIDFDF